VGGELDRSLSGPPSDRASTSSRASAGGPASAVASSSSSATDQRQLLCRRVVAHQARIDTEARSAAAAARRALSPRYRASSPCSSKEPGKARIGAELGISDRTVESHVAAIFAKPHVATRAEPTAQVLVRYSRPALTRLRSWACAAPWSLGAHVMIAETSAARDPTCALSSIEATWDSTVRSEIPSSAPMRALLDPWTSHASTSA